MVYVKEIICAAKLGGYWFARETICKFYD